MLRIAWWCVLTSKGGYVAEAEAERNNWVVLVDTSRYWYNYRHAANVLSFYHTIKRLGVPDSQIILFLAEDMACNPRNMQPGTIYNDMHHPYNLYGEHVEVDYRGDEVSVDNFIRLLTGRHPPNTPRSKRLLTDPSSNIFIFITGHSGEEFIKFQDWEELTSNDIADAFEQMHKQRRYRKIFWMSDTCQAASLQNQFYTPGIVAMGSSDTKENSYSHHVDSQIGIAIVDRFSYHSFDYLKRLSHSSKDTIKSFHSRFSFGQLNSHPQVRSDLYGHKSDSILLTDFMASTGTMHFWSDALLVLEDPRAAEALGSCASPSAVSNKTCHRFVGTNTVASTPDTRGSQNKMDILRHAAPLLSILPGFEKQAVGERAATTVASGDITTLSLGWCTGIQGFNPVVIGWLLGFTVLVSLLGLCL
jgi:phosphatidylinositol glycan class K